MEANGLMIGDYFYRPDCVDRVVEIHKNGVIGSDPLRGLIPWSEIKPIALTAEILEKNGFKHYITKEDDDSFEYSEGNFSYCFNRTTDGYMSCIDVTASFTITGLIKYIHELQQALRLCGLNEIADNLKI